MDEDGGKDESRRHQGSRHLLQRLDGRILRREPLLDVMLDRLDDDDGVIHDESNGQHETEERKGVQGKAEQGEEGEGPDQ